MTSVDIVDSNKSVEPNNLVEQVTFDIVTEDKTGGSAVTALETTLAHTEGMSNSQWVHEIENRMAEFQKVVDLDAIALQTLQEDKEISIIGAIVEMILEKQIRPCTEDLNTCQKCGDWINGMKVLDLARAKRMLFVLLKNLADTEGLSDSSLDSESEKIGGVSVEEGNEEDIDEFEDAEGEDDTLQHEDNTMKDE